MLLGDEGDGEAARLPGKPSLVLPRLRDFLVEREVRELASSVRSDQRTTASTGAGCSDTRNLL